MDGLQKFVIWCYWWLWHVIPWSTACLTLWLIQQAGGQGVQTAVPNWLLLCRLWLQIMSPEQTGSSCNAGYFGFNFGLCLYNYQKPKYKIAKFCLSRKHMMQKSVFFLFLHFNNFCGEYCKIKKTKNKCWACRVAEFQWFVKDLNSQKDKMVWMLCCMYDSMLSWMTNKMWLILACYSIPVSHIF